MTAVDPKNSHTWGNPTDYESFWYTAPCCFCGKTTKYSEGIGEHPLRRCEEGYGCRAQSTYSPTAPETKRSIPIPTGFNCCQCNGRNDYAEPNLPNGKYICYECR